MGKGDPSSHEPDHCLPGGWQRHLFGGKAQLILRAGTHPGALKVQATAAGLQPATLSLQAQ